MPPTAVAFESGADSLGGYMWQLDRRIAEFKHERKGRLKGHPLVACADFAPILAGACRK